MSFALRALIGRFHPRTKLRRPGKWETVTVPTNSSTIEIALDGEINDLLSPLEFRILAYATIF